MGKALYRQYRPKRLEDVVGQEHITTTLAKAVASGKISHAYLFTGPRGVGKTTIARILAHTVNNLPYTDDTTHLDIIEIDAASNRRIDEIRELRDRVHSAPTSAKYKVYIIDEVHMLTKEAFNALLKTLEEPPAHAIFILATTESHKLPDTIVSRTQRYSFKPGARDAVAEHLITVAKQEKASLDSEAASLIAEAGGGSFRDSMSLLDQVMSSGADITAEEVYRVLGIAPKEAIQELRQQLDSGTVTSVVAYLQQLRDSGYQAGQISKQLARSLREALAATPANNPVAYLRLASELLEVPAARDVEAKLDVVLIGFVLARLQGDAPGNTSATPPSASPSTPAPSNKPTSSTTSSPVVNTPSPADTPSATTAQSIATPQPPEAAEPAKLDVQAVSDAAEIWPATLAAIKQRYNTLYGVARMARAELQNDTLTLYVGFPFHHKRLNETRNKQIIVEIASAASGRPVQLVCQVDEAMKQGSQAAAQATPEASVAPPSDEVLTSISAVFGASEVLP